MTRAWCFLILTAALAVAGCGSSTSTQKKMIGSIPPTWPALQALQDSDGVPTVGMGMDREGPKSAKMAAANPAFKKVLDDFEKEPIPSKFATSARETAKKDLVESLRKLPDAPDGDVKALWEKASASLKTLTAP